MGPTVPDLRGMFLRGHGSRSHLQWNGGIIGSTWTAHQSGALGQVQGDAIRNISSFAGGTLYRNSFGIFYPTGAFSFEGESASVQGTSASVDRFGHTTFNAANVVPTAMENRPVNQAVRYLIRAAR